MPTKYLDNWMLFVNACRLILRPAIQQIDVDKAHSLFLQFLIGCEKLYPKITINQHLQSHLKEAIENFSTPYAFWLFSFERCNGYLGSFNTNNRNVELTFMKKFWEVSRLKSNSIGMMTRIFNSSSSSAASNFLLGDFMDYLDDHIFDRDIHSTRIRKNREEGYDPIVSFNYATDFATNVTGSEPLPFGTVPDLKNRILVKKVDMAHEHYQSLKEFYKDTYGFDEDMFVSKTAEKFSSVRLHGKTYNCAESRSEKGTNVQCLFLSQIRAVPEAWPGKVMYFFRHEQKKTTQSTVKTAHVFAFVRFYSPYSNSNATRKFEKQGLEVWSSKYAPISRDCIVPLLRIYSQVAVAKKQIRRRAVQNTDNSSFPIVIIPLQRNLHA